MLFGYCLPVSAEDTSTPQDSENSILSMDSVRQSLKTIGSGVDYITRPVDNYFSGEDDSGMEPDSSSVKLSLTHLNSKLKPEELDFSFDIKVRLPKTEHKLKLFVEDVNRSLSSSGSSTDSVKNEETEDDGVQVGILNVFNVNEWLKLKWKTGGRFSNGSLDLFATLKNEYLYPISESWQGKWQNELFTYQSIGEGFLSHLYFDQKINLKWNFRSTTALGIYDEEKTVYYKQTLAWYQRSSENRRFSYSLGRTWSHLYDLPREHDRDFLSILMRQRLYQKWVYLSVEPGLQYEKDYFFEQDPFLLLKVELYSNDVEI